MGAKGAVEIIFGGKDVEKRTLEYTDLFANPMVRTHGSGQAGGQTGGGGGGNFYVNAPRRRARRARLPHRSSTNRCPGPRSSSHTQLSHA